VVRRSWARAQGVNPSSAIELLCELGQVTQPLWAFWSRDGSHGSACPLELVKDLNKPNTCKVLQMGPAHAESSMKVSWY